MKMEVQQTEDYGIFKSFDINRTIRKTQVKNLIASISQNNLLHLNPIIVDKEMRIIDGQHRLAAAKQLELPVSYIIMDGSDSAEALISLNSVQKAWDFADYANCYQADPTVKFLEELHEAYKIPLPVLFRSFCRKANKNLHQLFDQGLALTLTENEIRVICRVGNELYQNSLENPRTKAKYKGRAFLRSLTILWNHPDINHDRLRDRLMEASHQLPRSAPVGEYTYLLGELYNFGLHKDNRINVKEE